jgi:hypothetical protein
MNSQQYSGSSLADTSSSLSNFWGDCPLSDIRGGLRRGWWQSDDFAEWAPIGFATGALQTTEGGISGKYKVYSATAGTWVPVNAVPTTDIGGGLIRGNADSTGDQVSLAFGAAPFLLNNTCGKLWCEVRLAVTSILTNMSQIFVGLGETTVMLLGAAQPLGDTDIANATGALIGFNTLEDGLGVLNSCYEDRSTTWTNVKAGLTTGLAANTFIKLGMVYNPNDSTNAITFYVNGVRQANVISATTLAALTSLDVKGLGLCVAMYADTGGTANYLYLDWWHAYQLGV